ncbi:MAG: hypothetical protein MZV64_60300 [Ignavibacteriales bacterium]|nr:hypothetical protein [Ignavibacteriales bacterium]
MYDLDRVSTLVDRDEVSRRKRGCGAGMNCSPLRTRGMLFFLGRATPPC